MSGKSVKQIAERYQREICEQVENIGHPILLKGFLASGNNPSLTYAKYTQNACEKVGIQFELVEVAASELVDKVRQANEDDKVHAIMIYYPIFGDENDIPLKDIIDPQKDIEGLSTFWTEKLYDNVRTFEAGKKSILPCTSLAIQKVVEESIYYKHDDPLPLKGVTVTVFNRSDVVGKPLAAMLANDGAEVFSFDLDGPMRFIGSDIQPSSISRSSALECSQVVITGVPSKDFEKVKLSEVNAEALCINFSTFQNFDQSVEEGLDNYYKRVGLLTVTMCMRNAVRLAKNFSQ